MSCELTHEMRAVSHIVQENKPLIEVLCYTVHNNFFLNVAVALRILLSLPVMAASGKCSFSKIKITETYLCSTMAKTQLERLAMISDEHEISKKLEYTDLISDSANMKVSKSLFIHQIFTGNSAHYVKMSTKS